MHFFLLETMQQNLSIKVAKMVDSTENMLWTLFGSLSRAQQQKFIVPLFQSACPSQLGSFQFLPQELVESIRR